MRRSSLVSVVAVVGLAVGLAGFAHVPTKNPGASSSVPAAADDDWSLSTTTYAPNGEGGYVPTYLGNGYFSARIPAQGSGFANAPVTTESQLAGFYGQGPGTTVQRANLPAWSTLGYSDGSGTFGNTSVTGCAVGVLCEAEAGTFTGTRLATDHTGYTGTGFVAGFAASGNVPQRGNADAVAVKDASAGTATLAVRYSAGANATTQTLSVSVNGGAASTLSMPATKDWNTWATATVPVTLAAGDNTVALACGTSDTCVANIDSLSVAPTPCVYGEFCEAESGALKSGTKLASNHTGSTGTGFVAGFASNNVPARGASDTIAVKGASAGAAVLSVRYAAATDGSTQSLTATVNGAAPKTVSMPATPTWDTWQTATVPVTLSAGDNTVALTCGSSDTCLVNIDALAVSAEPLGADSGGVSDYKQTLDLHTGVLTTSLTWTSPAGHRTDLTYTDFVSQAQAHVAAVRVTAKPVGWSGQATFTDLLDGRADTLPVSHRTAAPINLTTISKQTLDSGAHRISEKASTAVLGMTAGLASTLAVDGSDADTTRQPSAPADSIGQQGVVDVKAGDTYTVTKYVGVASGTDTADGSVPLATATTDPVQAAESASSAAARTGWGDLLKAHEAAWAKLWTSDVTIPGDSALTLKARASMFYLLESIRDGVEWSMSPGGLSSAEYNGHVFWDAETWMYPALLAAHPDLASGMNDYRSSLLDAAKQIATTNKLQGAQFPWESAQSGADVGIHPREIHITGDIALAQWDYYQATGDLTWLRNKGWPLLQAVAQFYTSRSVSNGNGGYDLKGVEGPDEDHDNVNNSAYVNVSAITSLQIAQKAAALVGQTPDPAWDTVAKGLAASIPFDPTTNTHPEYDGYSGQTVNQADVVMMQYPWNYPMDKDVAQADLDYYTPRTSLSGPAMTDAINMIDTATLSTPGCAAYTYFQRSVDPYDVGPFDQYSEHLGATGVIDFTTGIGGFLQELYYGFTGMRWGTDGLTLDPMLPPQLPGLRLTGVQWQGRTFDIDVTPEHTTVTLQSGAALPVTIAGTKHSVTTASPLTVDTRRPDLTPTNDVARCDSVDATSADPSYPATAAVDGSDATEWKPTAAGASLIVDLGAAKPVRHVKVLSGASSSTAYSISVSSDGDTWTTLGSTGATSDTTTAIDADPSVSARYVRYQAASGVTPSIASLTVTTGLPGAPTGVTATPVVDAGTTVSWVPPTDSGDSAITGYVVTPYADGKAGTPVTVTGTSTTFDDLTPDVDHTYTVSAINGVGTGPASDPSKAVRWSPPDTTPPTVTLTTDPAATPGTDGWFASAVKITARGADDVGVVSTELSIDGGAWIAGSDAASATATLTADGVHTVKARTTDAAGNVSAVASVTVKIDTDLPDASATFDETHRVLTLHASDAGSGVDRIEYRMDATATHSVARAAAVTSAWQTYTVPLRLGAAATVVQYRAVDRAGNVSAVHNVTVPAASSGSSAPGSGTTTSDGPTTGSGAARASGAGSTAGSSGAGATSSPADTGSNLGPLVWAGVLALLAGFALLLLGGRRRRTRAHR